MAWGSTGATVVTSKESSSSILFALNGTTPIRQYECVLTTEIRGLDETTAKGKVPDGSTTAIVDNTVQTTYYTNGLGDGAVYSFTATTGTKTIWSASRVDETNQWVATKKEYTYCTSAIGNAWGTTKLDTDGEQVSLSQNGTSHVVSIDKSSSHVFTFYNYTLVSTVLTTVTEIRYVDTQAHAETIVNNNTQVASYVRVHTPETTTGPNNQVYPAAFVVREIPYGTEKSASARPVAGAGWTVTVTTKVYGYTGNGWSAYSS